MQPRPFSFSRRLAVLCFGCSFAIHGAVTTGLLFTDVPPASAWSSERSEDVEGERHVVRVTFSMKMTDFAKVPAVTEPAEQEERDTSPPPLPPTDNPLGDPNGGHTDTLTPSQPADPPPVQPTPDPSAMAELILQDLLSTPNPIDTQQESLAPLPQAAEQLDQPAPMRLRLAQTDPRADLIDDLLPDISEQLEQITQEQAEEAVEQAEPVEDEADPVEQTEPDEKAEPTPPQATDAIATDDDEQDDRPAAKVYDEDSVDQPIVFDKMKRPKPPAVSKRLGETGVVRILIEVNDEGKLVGHTVVDDAGHPRLLAAAVAALKDSTFLPAEHRGEPVNSTRMVEYRF